MRWPDERYVRLYTRDTLTWKRLGWEGRAVLPQLMRKVDRAGMLEIGAENPATALADLLDLPPEVAGPAWEKLLATETAILKAGTIYLPHFVEAQETPQSDAQRKRDQRERARADLLGPRDAPMSRVVTPSHTASQPVTPNCAVPSLAEPTQKQLPLAPSPAQRAPAPESESHFVAFVRSEWPDVPNLGEFEGRALEAFPGIDLMAEARKARGWERSDRSRRKKNHSKFLWGWLGRAQDNASRNGDLVAPTVLRHEPVSPERKAEIDRELANLESKRGGP